MEGPSSVKGPCIFLATHDRSLESRRKREIDISFGVSDRVAFSISGISGGLLGGQVSVPKAM
jgi:hypothetical protein